MTDHHWHAVAAVKLSLVREPSIQEDNFESVCVVFVWRGLTEGRYCCVFVPQTSRSCSVRGISLFIDHARIGERSARQKKLHMPAPCEPCEPSKRGGFSSLLSAVSAKMEEDFDTVTINVGGTRFETARATLARHPDTRLSALDETSSEYGPKRREFYFDRDPALFLHILNFYRFGDLHFPRDLCGPTIRRELDFWGIDMQHVAPCCWGFFQACFDNDVTLKLLRQAFDTPEKPPNVASGASKWKITKSRMNRFLEDPSSSAWAKVGFPSFYSPPRLIYILGMGGTPSAGLTMVQEIESCQAPAKRPFTKSFVIQLISRLKFLFIFLALGSDLCLIVHCIFLYYFLVRHCNLCNSCHFTLYLISCLSSYAVYMHVCIPSATTSLCIDIDNRQ